MTKGPKSWVILVHEDQLLLTVTALRNARIEFVASLGGLTKSGRDVVFEVDHARYSENQITLALSP